MDYANKVLNDAETIFPEKVEFKAVDQSAWTEGVPDKPGVGKVKATFKFKEDYSTNKKRELIVSFLGAYKLYWDGQLIAESGKVSESLTYEVPGHLDRKYILPDTFVGIGTHELVLNYSDHKNTRRYQLADFSVEPYNEYFNRSQAQAILIYTLAGIFLIVTVYYFFMYFNTYRNISHLLFALLCAVSFVLIVYAYSRNYYPYTYDDYHLRQTIIWTLSFLVTLLLPLFYLYYFDHPHKRIFLVGIPVTLLISAVVSWPLGFLYTLLSVLLPLYFVIWALVKGRKGGVEAMVGLIVFLSGFMYFNVSVYVGFGILVIATLFSLSVSLGAERRQHEESMIRSSRLESQLLRKNIQPHFLMNTLTNIISLIESDPKLSIRLIEALSDEFYAMMDMADKQLITLRKEIELCEAHLQVMSIRNDVDYEMNINQLDEDVKIPPAILHTLIENGITHNLPINGKVVFELCQNQDSEKYEIQLLTYGKPKSKENMIEDGTGMKYIKSRLEESFSGKWHLENTEINEGWKTKITILK